MASLTDMPIRLFIIIDVDDVDIAHASPSNLISFIVSFSILTYISILSIHDSLLEFTFHKMNHLQFLYLKDEDNYP